jgi:aerobic-type carbon monoxide dehydrogenase small subunit (CoxS/CutS family)
MSAQMMTAAYLLEQNPNPNEDEIRQALNSVYCRCGTYYRIRKAVKRASEYMASSEEQVT